MTSSDCVYLSGEFLAESRASVPVQERGFLYGDGLFETIRVAGGRMPFWDDHMVRFTTGAATLRIKPPKSREALLEIAEALLRRNAVDDGLLRIQLTRGQGRRG